MGVCVCVFACFFTHKQADTYKDTSTEGHAKHGGCDSANLFLVKPEGTKEVPNALCVLDLSGRDGQ